MHSLCSPELVTINEQYISNNKRVVDSMTCPLLKESSSPKICIIKSSMGTGKSSLIKQWCENYTVLVIGARITFCDMMTKLLNLEHYQTAITPFSVFTQPRLVVQLQSILKFEGILTPKCNITCSYNFLIFYH